MRVIRTEQNSIGQWVIYWDNGARLVCNEFNDVWQAVKQYGTPEEIAGYQGCWCLRFHNGVRCTECNKCSICCVCGKYCVHCGNYPEYCSCNTLCVSSDKGETMLKAICDSCLDPEHTLCSVCLYCNYCCLCAKAEKVQAVCTSCHDREESFCEDCKLCDYCCSCWLCDACNEVHLESIVNCEQCKASCNLDMPMCIACASCEYCCECTLCDICENAVESFYCDDCEVCTDCKEHCDCDNA